MRWIKLYTTSPSGKTMFCCKYCGSITPAPGKSCPNNPQKNGASSSSTCAELEEEDKDRILHPLRKAAISKSITIVNRVREAKTDEEAVKVVRQARSATGGYIKTALGLQLKKQAGFLASNWWVLMSILDDIHREVRSK